MIIILHIGKEGSVDGINGNLGRHRHHRHHSRVHKNRKQKNSTHHNISMDKDRMSSRYNTTELVEELKAELYDNHDSNYTEFARSKRSSLDVSRWQDLLDSLKYERHSHSDNEGGDSESNRARQLDILEDIKHQIKEMAMASESGRHDHHKQHLTGNTEASKLEGEAHSHGISHHHKHGQLPHDESKPLDNKGNQVAGNNHHPHSHSTQHNDDAHSNFAELEKQVFQDVLQAENGGLTNKQELQLEKEIESLEEMEKSTGEHLTKSDSGPQTKQVK